MSLDALSALEDTLPAAKPVPESPKLRPEDIVEVCIESHFILHLGMFLKVQ